MQPDWLGPVEEQRIIKGMKVQWRNWLVGREEILGVYSHWSWSGIVVDFKERFMRGLVRGLSLGLIAGLLVWLFVGFDKVLGTAISSTLLFYLTYFLVGALYSGLTGGDVELHKKPNYAIWRSLVAGLLSYLLFCLVLVAVMWSIAGELNTGLVILLFWLLLIGLRIGWETGLDAFVRHFALRKLLAKLDYLPWQLVPFLEFAKERLLLHRVGGGYIFIHRTLQDYFAAQDTSFDIASTER
jgi:hypothetical protein